MRKMKTFAKGGSTDRAERMRERRMADIEKDFQKALAKGKSEKEARAKRDQRIADAKDDYAKRTGADRTETRAAEKAAEAKLTATRRGVDKDIKPLSITSGESKSLAAKMDMPEVKAPKAGGGYDSMSFSAAFRQAMKDKGKGETFTWKGKSYKLETAGDKKPAAPRRGGGRSAAPAASAAGKSPAGRSLTPAAGKPGLTSDQYTRAVNTGIIPANASAEDRANIRATIKGIQDAKYNRPASTPSASVAPKRGYVAGSSHPAQARGFAKGGKIDGCAVRGKTRAARKK